MYPKPKVPRTSINVNQAKDGETIEMKVERITSNKEPIKDGAPIIFSERKQGVLAGTNIRTDRFEVAVDATDKITGAKFAKREGKLKALAGGQESDKNPETKSGTEPTQGTNS